MPREYRRDTFDGVEVTYAVDVPGKAEKGAAKDVCHVCGLSFRSDKFRRYKGKAYGVPCGCYKDIKSIRLKEGK